MKTVIRRKVDSINSRTKDSLWIAIHLDILDNLCSISTSGIGIGSIVCGLLFDINPKRALMYFTIYGLTFVIIQILVNWHLGDPPVIEGECILRLD